MRTDRRTDISKLMVAFRNSANASKNRRCVLLSNSVLHVCGISLFAYLYGAVGLCSAFLNLFLYKFGRTPGRGIGPSQGLPTLEKIRHAHGQTGGRGVV